jgi:hypothetical protein
MAKTEPLDRRVVEQMLVGVATRQYARSLEPLDPAIESQATTKSADDLALAVLLVDGVHVSDHCLIVALGVTEDGTKPALGVWEGSRLDNRHHRASRRASTSCTSRSEMSRSELRAAHTAITFEIGP